MVGSDDNVVHVVWYACRVSSWSSSSSWIIWSRVIFLFSCLFLVLFFLKNVFTTCIFLFFFFFFWKSFLLPVFMLNCQIIADKDEDATRKYLDQVI
jgi:NADH:ubiquinone oxidoreductase subunit 4 (subunit M)